MSRGWDPCDQRTEILLVGGQLHQDPPHLVHIEDAGRTQLIQLSQETAKWAGKNADIHAQPSRCSRWSPTRTALAIAVRAGFTALMLGKKLVSTT